MLNIHKRLKKITAAVLLTALAVAVISLPFGLAASEWTRTYGGKGDEVAYALVQTDDGGFAMAGVTNSVGAGGNDFWLVKTNAAGLQQWSRAYGGVADDVASSMVQTSDGGYALAGYTESLGESGRDFWLVKADSNGNPVWSEMYGGAGDEWARSVIQTSDGGYLLVGQTMPVNSSYSMFLVKTNWRGIVEWNQTLMDNAVAYSVLQTNDTGYAVAGITYGGSYGVYWFTLLKIDSAGNMEWNKTYSGDHNIFFSISDYGSMANLVQTEDGGYAIAGVDISAGFVLFKTDSSGNLQWEQTYRSNAAIGAYALTVTSDGGFALAGDAGDWAHIPGFEFCLVKTNSTGSMNWTATFGGMGQDQAYGLVQTRSDGGYALAGYTVKNNTNNKDFWLVKADIDPTVTPTPSPTPTPKPTPTPSNTSAPSNSTEPTPTNSSIPIPTETPNASAFPSNSTSPSTSPSVEPQPAESSPMTLLYVVGIAVLAVALTVGILFVVKKRR